MKVNAADRPIVFFKAVDQGSHAVVPQLNGRGMERNEDPWPGAVSNQSGQLKEAQGYLLGWKAMPFAREDLDSNYAQLICFARPFWRGAVACLGQHGRGGHGGGMGKPQLRCRGELLNRRREWQQSRAGVAREEGYVSGFKFGRLLPSEGGDLENTMCPRLHKVC